MVCHPCNRQQNTEAESTQDLVRILIKGGAKWIVRNQALRANNSVLGWAGPLHHPFVEGTDYVVVLANGMPGSCTVPNVCICGSLGNECQEGR